MGDHLLKGVKCVREVRRLTNALIISPSLFLDGVGVPNGRAPVDGEVWPRSGAGVASLRGREYREGSREGP